MRDGKRGKERNGKERGKRLRGERRGREGEDVKWKAGIGKGKKRGVKKDGMEGKERAKKGDRPSLY